MTPFQKCSIKYDSLKKLIFFPKKNLLSYSNCNWSLPCDPWQIKCGGSGFCIDVKYVCDGIFHCPEGDDEYSCG